MCKTANAVLTASAADLVCCCSSKNGKLHHFDKGEFLIVNVPINKDIFDCTFFCQVSSQLSVCEYEIRT